MAYVKAAFDGHTLEITSERIDVTPMTEPDPDWTFTDAAGHVHRYDKNAHDGPYPTLKYVARHGHAFDDDWCDYDDEQLTCYPVLACKDCLEKIVPGTRMGRAQSIPGMQTYLIDGEPVSPQAAQDFLANARRERLASGQVCYRCEEPLAADQGHVCSGMAANRDIQLLVRNIHDRGLIHVLSVLVGTDSAQKMIRDAAAAGQHVDRPAFDEEAVRAAIRASGLRRWLKSLVGPSAAKRMIREAWVSLDRDDREV